MSMYRFIYNLSSITQQDMVETNKKNLQIVYCRQMYIYTLYEMYMFQYANLFLTKVYKPENDIVIT